MYRPPACVQCGGQATDCPTCGAAYCERLVCSQLHAAVCAALSRLPAPPADGRTAEPTVAPRRASSFAPFGDAPALQTAAAQIVQLRMDGFRALAQDDAALALEHLLEARSLERTLERGGADLSGVLPPDEELETDLVPLARALSAESHPRHAEIWRHVLADRVPRSVQIEAAEWLARDAFQHDLPRLGLRALHAASALGGTLDPLGMRQAYQAAGLDAPAAFSTYLIASRLDQLAARALDVRDPLTGRGWADQDARWWLDGAHDLAREVNPPGIDGSRSEHRWEAVNRARDLSATPRDEGWVYLAEGDYDVGPSGPRALGRLIRSGAAEAADQELLARIRISYESAADRLPDNAWPWYRLAELVASIGWTERAAEYLAQAERRGMGDKLAERRHRPQLRALVMTMLDPPARPEPQRTRPFPMQPYGPQGMWRIPGLPDVRRLSARPRPADTLAAQVARHLADNN